MACHKHDELESHHKANNNNDNNKNNHKNDNDTDNDEGLEAIDIPRQQLTAPSPAA
jgi:hypothetical protein